ncbi:hypothetical protein LSB85_003682 [Salmonella enterica]|nr:hypothetical protein [Salmonella enterica]
MQMTTPNKSTAISNLYGQLMARMNGDHRKPNTDEWRNLASLAVIRMYELEQDLRIATSTNSTAIATNDPIPQSYVGVAPESFTIADPISLARSAAEKPLNLIEEALSRYGKCDDQSNSRVDAALCVKGEILQPHTPQPQRAPGKEVIQRGWTYNYRGKIHGQPTYEAMAKERRRLIRDGSYNNQKERELIQKYIPDNTDITTLNELGLLTRTSK